MTKEEMLECLWAVANSERTPQGLKVRLLNIRDFVSRAQIVPEGWQVVPKEATQNMVKATGSGWHFSDVYRVMLAAAPKPEETP